MFHDEFYYRPKFNPFFGTLCVRFEGDDDGGGGGDDGEHWTDNYESTKGNAVLKRFKTEEDSHKGHLETKTALSDPLRLPKSLGNATDEQKVEWNVKVAKLRGVPGSAEGYVLARPDDFPEGIDFEEDTEKAAKDLAKKHHLSQAAIQEFYNLHNGMIRKAVEKKVKDNETAIKATTKILEESLGKKECQESFVLIERLLRGYVNPEWQTVKEEDDEPWQDFRKKIYLSGIGNNEVIMRVLADAAPLLVGEGKIIAGSPPSKDTKDEDLSEKEKQKKHFPKSPDMVE